VKRIKPTLAVKSSLDSDWVQSLYGRANLTEESALMCVIVSNLNEKIYEQRGCRGLKKEGGKTSGLRVRCLSLYVIIILHFLVLNFEGV
jgi:hypothetical protein